MAGKEAGFWRISVWRVFLGTWRLRQLHGVFMPQRVARAAGLVLWGPGPVRREQRTLPTKGGLPTGQQHLSTTLPEGHVPAARGPTHPHLHELAGPPRVPLVRGNQKQKVNCHRKFEEIPFLARLSF